MINGKHEAAAVVARRSEAMPRIEIVADRRRAHTAEFRANVVAESLVAGVRVQDVAERRWLCPSLIYRWRRTARWRCTAGADAAGDAAVRLFPVRIAAAPDETSAPELPASRPAAAHRAGSIEIELAGDVRVRVDESVSVAALRRVMSVLRGC